MLAVVSVVRSPPARRSLSWIQSLLIDLWLLVIEVSNLSLILLTTQTMVTTGSSPHKENPHSRAGNRTRDLVISKPEALTTRPRGWSDKNKIRVCALLEPVFFTIFYLVLFDLNLSLSFPISAINTLLRD